MNYFTSKFNIEKFYSDESINIKILPEPLNRRSVFFTLYGRNGLYQGLLGIKKITKRNTILVPVYSCGDEIKTILNAGFNIQIFNIKSDLTIDIKDIEVLVSQDIAAILITHYFGFPITNITQIKKICKKYNIFLIEDCAHALASSCNDKSLGEFGDISIFSLRKFYPIPHGGALVINNPKILVEKFIEPPSEAVIVDLHNFLGYRLGINMPGTLIIDLQTTNVRKDIHGPRLVEYGGYCLAISKFAMYLINRANSDEIIKQRKLNYKYLYELFRENEAKLSLVLNLLKLEENVCPMFFPLCIKNANKIVEKLKQKNVIICQKFWDLLHDYVNWNKYPHIKQIKKNMIIFPVTHRIRKKYLDIFIKIASELNEK